MDRYQGQIRYGSNQRPYAQSRSYQERTPESDKFPVAMAYVPWQTLEKTLPLCEGLNIGTIFPELNLPFIVPSSARDEGLPMAEGHFKWAGSPNEIGRCARK